MKPIYAILSVVISLSGSAALANDHLPLLDYNSPGIESDAQFAIENREAQIVANEYKDLDQDRVPDRLDHCPNTLFGVKVDKRGCELDSDQDGVFDRLDQCPDTAPGVKVNIFGCEGDDDNDGVPNSKDQCPNTLPGVSVDLVGCAVIGDADKDCVKDDVDRCPNSPLGAKVNQYGCVPVNFVLTNIVFDSDKHVIRTDQRPILFSDAAALEQIKNDEVLLITGHTDWQAPQEYNERLSWRRAGSTKEFVVRELGHRANSVYVNGKGELEPVADNRTDEGRQMNRRIELQIIKRDELPGDARLAVPQSKYRK